MEIIFWISLFLVFYTFLGYGILLYFLVVIKRWIRDPKQLKQTLTMPSCTLIVAAFNEEEIIQNKIQNSLALDYPEGLLKIVFVSDGSTDQTPNIIAAFPEISGFYKTERKGKIHAIHRVVSSLESEVIVFTDANTLVNKDALLKLCRHYSDPKVGAVAGEKRVSSDKAGDATAGEGLYWKYESVLKLWDSELNSVIGAAGELFSIRRDLYVPIPHNSILDDFMISMRIALKGYKIVYEPAAFALETSSQTIADELKRKIRIAAGGIQSIIWLRSLLLPFRFPILTFQYISHRVLRWTITPFLLIIILVLNLLIIIQMSNALYFTLLFSQIMFYLAAALGWLLERRMSKIKALFVPYYFCMMNYAVMAGIFRYLFKEQSVLWEKARRKN